MSQKAERMKKMRDDDAIGYHYALKKLKSVGEEILAVLSLFPEDASTSEGARAEAESYRPGYGNRQVLESTIESRLSA